MDPVQQPSLFPLFVLGIFFIFMYFLAIRPQNKERKQREAMISALEKGDEVIVASGILGTIKDMKGNFIVVTVSNQFDLKLQKSAVASKLPNGTLKSIDNQ